MTNHKAESQIICNHCAKSKRLSSMGTTFFMGWWSKKGIFLTPVTFVSDLIKIFRTESEHKKVIDVFIENNTGVLRLALENQEDLHQILTRFNNLKN